MFVYRCVYVCVGVCMCRVFAYVCVCIYISGCLCVYVCMHVWMCVFVNVHAYIYECTDSRVCDGQKRGSGDPWSYLPFWRQALSLTWSLSGPLIWLASKPWRSSCLCRLSTGFPGACSDARFLCKCGFGGSSSGRHAHLAGILPCLLSYLPGLKDECNL